MFTHDNSITPTGPAFTNGSAREVTRKFQTILMNGFDGSSQPNHLDIIIAGLYPTLANTKRVTVCTELGENNLDIKEVIKMFNGKGVGLVIKTPSVEDYEYPMLALNVSKGICNYLLRDPDSLDIPYIIFDFASVPNSAKFMCDVVISSPSESLYPIGDDYVEITRQRNGVSGRKININDPL